MNVAQDAGAQRLTWTAKLEPGSSPEPSDARSLANLGRRTGWELINSLPLAFPTYHPQGMAFVNSDTFLSSVQVTEKGAPSEDPALRGPGAGIGHVFVLDNEGNLKRDIILGEGHIYHPGGIDYDGDEVWVPVSEYRANRPSIIYSIDPGSLQVRERFRVEDHIGWALRDRHEDLIHGGSWGSRRFYTWDTHGRLVDQWKNPSHFIDGQDAQLIGPGLILCSGTSRLNRPDGGQYELGGLTILDMTHRKIVHDFPVPVFSPSQHVVTRNPMTTTKTQSSEGFLLHVAPDDGTDPSGTVILTYSPVPAKQHRPAEGV